MDADTYDAIVAWLAAPGHRPVRVDNYTNLDALEAGLEAAGFSREDVRAAVVAMIQNGVLVYRVGVGVRWRAKTKE